MEKSRDRKKPSGWVRLKPVVETATQPSVPRVDRRKKAHWCKYCSERGMKCPGASTCPFMNSTIRRSEKTADRAVVARQGTRQGPGPGAHGLSRLQDMTDSRLWISFFQYIDTRQCSRKFPTLPVSIALPFIMSSEPLYHVCMAIATLHASRQGGSTVVDEWHPHRPDPFVSYQRSIRTLQLSLQGKDVAQRDDVLFTTFFLVIFEAISGSPGSEWTNHLQNGTCKLVEMAGLRQPLSLLRMCLLEEFRVCEISRAVFYEEETFLSRHPWQDFFRQMGTTIPEPWDPLDTTMSLATKVSSFHRRLVKLVASVPEEERKNVLFLHSLRIHGLQLQQEVYDWGRQAIRHKSSLKMRRHILLGFCYYHALLVYLSDGFGRYTHWGNRPTPLLSDEETRSHILDILGLAAQVCDNPLGIGMLLLFPIKVAGFHANEAEERGRVLHILDQLYWGEFTISKRLKVDLQQLWASKGRWRLDTKYQLA